MYVIYYECMDTACLFIDNSCVYVGFLFFSPRACLCAHIKTVIRSVHVTGVERGGGRLTSVLFVLCAAAQRTKRLPSAQMDINAKSKTQILTPTCEEHAEIGHSI